MGIIEHTGAGQAPHRVRFTVLGAAGFIGNRLVEHLRARGHECLAPERGDDLRAHLDSGPDSGHVVYCAGLTADFRERPLDTVEAHVCLLRGVLSDLRFDTLTYLSSTRVYLGATDTEEGATVAVNPHDANDVYNLSKLLGESLCLHGGRSGVRVARLSNVVGLRSDGDFFLDQLLAEGFSTGSIRFRTAPGSAKDYIHVDDVVAALEGIALCDEAGVFNVATGQSTTNREIAETIHRMLGFRCEFDPDAPEVDFAPIRTDRLRAVCGFNPRPFSEFFPQYLSDYAAARTGREEARS